MDNIVIIGRIGAPYGLKGWNRVHSFTQPKKNILDYEKLYVCDPKHRNNFKKFECQAIYPHGHIFVAKFVNCHDRTQAALLTHYQLGVDRGVLPVLADDEHYWIDLKDMKVFNVKYEMLGYVINFVATSANDVLVVKDNIRQKEHWIPYVDQHILYVDIENQQIQVDWNMEL